MEDQGDSELFSIVGAKETSLEEVWLMGQVSKEVLKSPFLQAALRQAVFLTWTEALEERLQTSPWLLPKNLRKSIHWPTESGFPQGRESHRREVRETDVSQRARRAHTESMTESQKHRDQKSTGSHLPYYLSLFLTLHPCSLTVVPLPWFRPSGSLCLDSCTSVFKSPIFLHPMSPSCPNSSQLTILKKSQDYVISFVEDLHASSKHCRMKSKLPGLFNLCSPQQVLVKVLWSKYTNSPLTVVRRHSSHSLTLGYHPLISLY